MWNSDKGLAFCGLACVLCDRSDCPGCKARGCNAESDCAVYACVTARGLDGCYECDDFPCGEDRLQGVRNRAFNRYARARGKTALLERLRANHENGIVYHRPGSLTGDYDAVETEADVLRLIAFGSPDPYTRCPVLETERFTLRLVQSNDAEDLLACYADPKAQALFNADNCSDDFCYQTLEAMRERITNWIGAYEWRAYVRYAIIDRARGCAVGTIEMFGRSEPGVPADGILRLDIAAAYETSVFLRELFQLCAEQFFLLFGVEQIITKAVPLAAERVRVLEALGFQPHTIPGRESYWALNNEGADF